MNVTDMTENSLNITTLPPELIDKVFSFLRNDIDQCIRLTKVCKLFKEIIVNGSVDVEIPLSPNHFSWIQDNGLQVRSLHYDFYWGNHQITNLKYHKSQIECLNLENLKVARLLNSRYIQGEIESDDQPRVHWDYMRLVRLILEKSKNSLSSFDVNVDLMIEEEQFRFIEILKQFPSLSYLTLHFGYRVYDYEWRMSTIQFSEYHAAWPQSRDGGLLEMDDLLKNNFREFRKEPQQFVDILFEKLPQLKTLYIHNYPSNRVSVSSKNLVEFGVVDSDTCHVRFDKLDLPKVEKIFIFDDTEDLRAALSREWYKYPGLVSILYNGCPNLKVINNLVLRSENLTGENRMEMEDWGKTIIGKLTLWNNGNLVEDFI